MNLRTWVIAIDGWLPERVNVLLRCHWSQRKKLMVTASQQVGLARLLAGVPRADDTRARRRVSVVYQQPRGPAADPDARWKHLLDALVRAGLLVDDSPKWCELGSVETVRGPRQTVVTLEDVG